VFSIAYGGEVDAISSVVLDLGRVNAVSVAPGRIAVLRLPEAIAEAKNGAPRKLRALPSASDPNELSLFWVEGAAFRTNLIVRTTKRTFVFDVIPVTSGHQDFIQVRAAYGAPRFKSIGRTITETSLAPKAEPKLKVVRKLLEGNIE
jgi:hypothetical protein